MAFLKFPQVTGIIVEIIFLCGNYPSHIVNMLIILKIKRKL